MQKALGWQAKVMISTGLRDICWVIEQNRTTQEIDELMVRQLTPLSSDDSTRLTCAYWSKIT